MSAARHRKLAWLAGAVGRPDAEADQYTETAAALKRGIIGNLARPATACDPPVGPCFADGMNESHTSVQATMYVLVNRSDFDHQKNKSLRALWVLA